MSQKELLRALEEDTKRECRDILENAQKEADAIIQTAAQEGERLKEERLRGAKASLEQERLRILADARLHAHETLLKEKRQAIVRVMNEVKTRMKALSGHKEYPQILSKLFEEAMNTWNVHRKHEAPVVITAKQDMQFLKKGVSSFRPHSYEVIADETGTMSSGVMVMSKDKRFRIINTLDSRLEKAKVELDHLIHQELFSAETMSASFEER